MYKVNVNDLFSFNIEELAGKYTVNKEEVTIDSISVGASRVNILLNGKVYQAEVVRTNHVLKTFTVKVNSNSYKVNVKDKYDELLHQLGLDEISSVQVLELKAPMPGMVLRVFVKEGDKILQGGSLLTLEAMKMENIIKAPVDVVIKKVNVSASDKVERNQLLITFE
ncbi:MAG: acetyl-CoA carboxylase biotin carboxyl carrier protein subunit [Daejeonella sp.]|nr:acetyl-CoA carboxylase biotin carboxyl carrier protein subunit [Daejeonella sp.]